MNSLEVKNLSKSYKDFKLQNISFELPKGYIMGYVGQNGAGKTTTINLITQVCSRDSGTVKIDGISYKDNPSLYKEMIGFIGDESYFPKEFTLTDVKRVLNGFYPSFREGEFDSRVKDWGLPEKQKLDSFSRGMKVKLMFASAMSRDTKLLLLDEATNGLDPVIRSEVLGLLQDYIADGQRSILFSTHNLEDLEQIADYIIFIDQGKLLLRETKDELLESYILVKGGEQDLTEELKKRLIGTVHQEFGFEGLLASQDAALLNKKFIMEKPKIDQVMIHMIRQNRR